MSPPKALSHGLKARVDNREDPNMIKAAPHCFTMCKGSTMPPKHRERVQSFEQDAVYCCVKSYIRDVDLQQDPLVMIKPGWSLLSRVPQIVKERDELSEKQVRDAHALMHVCKNVVSPALERTVQALTDRLLKRTYNVPKLDWMLQPLMTEIVRLPEERNQYFPHLPASTWQLQAKITRAKL